MLNLKKQLNKILSVKRDWSQNFHVNRLNMNVKYDAAAAKQAKEMREAEILR